MASGITLIRVYWVFVMITLFLKAIGAWAGGWLMSIFGGPNELQAFGILEMFVAGALMIGIFTVGKDMEAPTYYYALGLQGILIADSGVLTSPNLGNIFLFFLNLLIIGYLVGYALKGEAGVYGEAIGDVDAWIVVKSGLAVIAGAIIFFLLQAFISAAWTGTDLLGELKRELEDLFRRLGG